MTFSNLNETGLVLVGCGRMGSALLRGWLRTGLVPEAVTVSDPAAPSWLATAGVRVNAPPPPAPGVVVIAIKPQTMDDALAHIAALGGDGTLFLSIAAGTRIARLAGSLGRRPIVRVMPNMPALVGRGASALCRNAHVTDAQFDLATRLMAAVGEVVRLDDEDQLDAVTALSGSGPAYVFHLIEAMAAAGVAEGLPADIAMRLARATVAGAGELVHASNESARELRIAIASPGGTTEAALRVLMEPGTGLAALMRRAVHAAAARGRELGQEAP